MDRRIALIAFVALAVLIWLGRSRILDIVTRSGGFELLPPVQETVELPPIKSPALPNFVPGPETWAQTTGLMCACDLADYVAPIIIETLTVPQAPVPRYQYQPQPTQIIAQTVLTYYNFGMNDSFTVWGNRPSEQVYMGSDGRIFLRPKGLLRDQPNVTNDPLFIGTNEYRMEGADIIYGPYRYKPGNGSFSAGSA